MSQQHKLGDLVFGSGVGIGTIIQISKHRDREGAEYLLYRVDWNEDAANMIVGFSEEQITEMKRYLQLELQEEDKWNIG